MPGRILPPTKKGGDLLALYAAIHGLPQAKAAQQVAADYGLEDVAGIVRRADASARARRHPHGRHPHPKARRAR